MMKRYWIIVLLLFFHNQVSAQLSLKIDSLIISNMIEVREKNVITGHFGDGPTIAGFLTIENETDTNFFRDQNRINISIEFVRKDGSILNRLLWTSYKEDNQGKYIEAHKRISVFDIVSMMLFEEEIEFANYYIIEHVSELKCILPSLTVVFTVNKDFEKRIPIDVISHLFIDDTINRVIWRD